MEAGTLKQAVEQIRLPQEARARILLACREQAPIWKEEAGMESKRARFPRKKMLTALAAAALCLCCAVAAAAAGRAGVFRDVTNWLGAVTGERYEQASAEILVSAACADGEVTLRAELVYPDEIPYRELDALAIESYQFLDADGKAVAAGGPTDAAQLQNGSAEWGIPCAGLAGGAYTLRIDGFVGSAKANAPLPIAGRWECAFEL